MQEKIQKLFFYFEIIAIEFITLDTRFYWDRILIVGCQDINKRSQDFRHY